MTKNAISLVALCSVMAFMNCHAAELLVTVSDARGEPVPDAVVIATVRKGAGSGTDLSLQGHVTRKAGEHPSPHLSLQGEVARSAGEGQRRSSLPPSSTPAVMDQIDKAFVPSLLVVRTGTPVIFPNSDTIAHQVYSFSAAKRFELGLYRGHPHPPVVFEQPGLIVLGCNIHDNMAGYIVVTDSPYFGKSDDRGAWRMSSLPAAEYEVTIWSPRLPRSVGMIKQRITLTEAQPGRAEFKLSHTVQASQETRRDARMLEY